MSEVLRVANASGFYGDRLAAAREMVEGGPIDVLTGDYLAELTMMILHKDRVKDPRMGFARTFLAKLQEVGAAAASRGIKIVVNAGGLNPAGCAEAARKVFGAQGVRARVAHIEGDDLLPQLAALQARGEALAHMDRGTPLRELRAPVLSANAYLGAWGIAEALARGADCVICPRVTDAALVVGPAAWRFGWKRDDWDRLASAVVAGHILACGSQATGVQWNFEGYMSTEQANSVNRRNFMKSAGAGAGLGLVNRAFAARQGKVVGQQGMPCSAHRAWMAREAVRPPTRAILMFTTLPVRAASITRSVCRQRKAGICSTSATAAAFSTCSTSCTSVRMGRP